MYFSDPNARATLLAVLCGLPQQAPAPRLLHVGDEVKGEVVATDPEVANGWRTARPTCSLPIRGPRFHLAVDRKQTCRLELHSHFFDAYLALRDGDGGTLAEDNDGLFHSHARIVADLEPGRDYLVDAGACWSFLGPFTLRVVAGPPKELTPEESATTLLADLREAVAAIAGQSGEHRASLVRALRDLGLELSNRGNAAEAEPIVARALELARNGDLPEGNDTASALSDFGATLFGWSRFDEARPLLERAWRIRLKLLGPDHGYTCFSLRNLAACVGSQGHLAEAVPLYEEALGASRKSWGPDDPQTARVLKGLAYDLLAQQRVAEAIPALRDALRIYRINPGPDAQDTLRSARDLGRALESSGAAEEARELYADSLRRAEATLGAADPLALDLMLRVGDLDRMAGRLDDAARLLERGEALARERLGPDHAATLNLRRQLANLRSDQGRYDDAERMMAALLESVTRLFGADHPMALDAAVSLARIRVNMGRYADAEPVLEHALELHRQRDGEASLATVTSMRDLWYLRHEQGRFEEARLLVERALAIETPLLGADDPNVIDDGGALARMFEAQDLDAQAEAQFKATLQAQERTIGLDHPRARAIEADLADVERRHGRRDEAERRLRHVLACAASGTTANPREESDTAFSLGQMLLEAGRYDEAEPLLLHALASGRELLGENHPQFASEELLVGRLRQYQGRFEEARPFMERALASNLAALGSDHDRTAATAQSLAVVERELGDLEKALASAHLSIAGYYAGLRRGLWTMSERERMQTKNELEKSLEVLLEIARQLGREEDETDGYQWVMRFKGQASRSLAATRAQLAQRLTPERARVVDELRSAQADLSRLQFTPGAGAADARAAQMATVEKRCQELELELVRSLGDAGSAEASTPAQLAAALAPDEAVVDFLVHLAPVGKASTAAVHKQIPPVAVVTAWVVRGGDVQPHRIELGPADVLQSAVQQWLAAIVGGDAAAARGATAAANGGAVSRTEAAKALRELLWNPVSPRLVGVHRLVLSPDRFLGALPFETIEVEPGVHLIERFACTYRADASARTRMESQSRPAEPRPVPGVLLVGGIDYDTGAGGSPTAHPAVSASPLVARVDRGGAPSAAWPPLPHTRDEVHALLDLHRSIVHESGAALVLEGGDATEERLKQELPRWSIVHVATHGFFLSEPPRDPSQLGFDSGTANVELLPGLRSGIVCAGANRPDGAGRDDGWLTAEEVSWLDLRKVDLVVLSACETGLGAAQGGEGVLGLRRALRQSGARAVVSSLWKVDDAATAALMRDFYRHLWIDRLPAAVALRRAQLDMLEKNRRTSGGTDARTWGAFVVDGEGD